MKMNTHILRYVHLKEHFRLNVLREVNGEIKGYFKILYFTDEKMLCDIRI